MTQKKILLLLGNPDKETYSGVVADTYEKAARASGHDVRRFNILETCSLIRYCIKATK
jgi:putative NADPH-quinone reductase